MQDAHGNARPWITGGNGKHDRMRGEEELKAHFDRVVNNAYARDAEAQMQFCRPAQTWETVVAHLGLKPPRWRLEVVRATSILRLLRPSIHPSLICWRAASAPV